MDIYPVGMVVTYLKQSIEQDALLQDLWVTGEISNVYRSANGHLYFTLKDAESAIRVVQWRGHGRAARVENGDAVIVHGGVSIYPARSELQIVADVVQPAGVGELQLRFEQLRAQLDAEGLFDPQRKRPLPRFPRRIGVVTSPSGAVLHDMLTVIGRRYPLVELVLAPTKVQGPDAPTLIARAIHALNRQDGIDLIVVARGGGSAEDLMAFNDERVARAIFASRYPVVSAVGHETDVTIADFVADVRAPTPSAAAELVTPDSADLRAAIARLRGRLRDTVTARLAEAEVRARQATLRLTRAAPDVSDLQRQVSDLTHRAHDRAMAIINRERAALARVQSQLIALDPTRTLRRGYALLEDAATGAPVRRVADVVEHQTLRARLADGAVAAVVQSVSREEP